MPNLATWDGHVSHLPATLTNANTVRIGQAKSLISEFGHPQIPTVVCGDCNTPPIGRVYEMLRTGIGPDAFDSAGSGFGFTIDSTWPYRRIDHAFLEDGLKAMHVEIPSVRASDHKPLVVDMNVD